jgi:hypothetical protein
MKPIHILLLFLLSYIYGCEKLDLKIEVPGCIEDKIREFKKSHFNCDSGAKAYRYDFQDIQVFVFEPGNCMPDFSTHVYDSSCNLICTLGGFAGNRICNGENFEENASNKILVWEY